MPSRKDLDNEITLNQDAVDSALLLQIATSDDPKLIVDDLMAKDIPTQVRAFMLLKARNELLRIIRVSETLRKLEDTYMERVLADQDGMDVKSLAKSIETMANSLQRSMDMVNSVINDKELKLVVEQTSNVYNDNRTNVVSYNVIQQSQEAREKLRQVSTRLLSSISKNPAEIVNLEAVSDDDVVIEAIEDGLQESDQ